MLVVDEELLLPLEDEVDDTDGVEDCDLELVELREYILVFEFVLLLDDEELSAVFNLAEL